MKDHGISAGSESRNYARWSDLTSSEAIDGIFTEQRSGMEAKMVLPAATLSKMLLAAALLSGLAAAAPTKKPNFLVLFVDDM